MCEESARPVIGVGSAVVRHRGVVSLREERVLLSNLVMVERQKMMSLEFLAENFKSARARRF